jgi:hypothetical protein
VTVRKLINNKYMHKYITKMYLGTRGENIDGKERGIERRREGAGREGEREREERERETHQWLQIRLFPSKPATWWNCNRAAPCSLSQSWKAARAIRSC